MAPHAMQAERQARRSQHIKTPGQEKRSQWDLAVAAGALALAAILSFFPPNLIFMWVGLTILLVAPGYILVQTIAQGPQPWHVVAGIGLSIPLIGLLALVTSLVPGGFQVTAIVLTVTIGVLGLAAVAWARRGRPAPDTV